jgi:hypothetical protein
MRTICKTVFSFDELSEKAKEKALVNFVSSSPFFWSNEWINSIKKGLEAFGSGLKDWSIDFSCSAHSYFKIDKPHMENDDLTGQRLRTWILNNYSHVLYSPKVYRKSWDGKKRMSKVFLIETECPFTGYCGDDVFLKAIREFIDKPCRHTTFNGLLRDCVENAISDACNDYEHQCSVEYFSEHAQANNYEFYEDGSLA